MPSPDAGPAIAQPLDYAPTVGRSRTRTLVGGIVVSLVYAFGFAMIAFGLMLSVRNDRDAPAVVATGVFSLILATGLIVTLWLARR